MESVLDWKSIGSILATFMFLRTALRDFVPPVVHSLIDRLFTRLLSAINPRVTILIEEYDSSSYNNELFDSVQSYLGSKCFSTANVLKLSKPKNSRSLSFSMDSTQRLDDTSFPGVPVRWSYHSVERKSSSSFSRPQEHRYFELSFHKSLKPKVHSEYIPYLMDEAAAIRFGNRERRLYTNRSAEDNGRFWSSVPFHHPATFDTVAIDPVLRDDLKSDLTNFVRRKEYYSRVGRAWKRGYLLYGPPGTGKTSLIAAIANFLEFDIYDLELTSVTNNSQLRKLLISTTSKSVVVVEDVDCTLDLSDRNKNKKKNNVPDVAKEGEEEEGREDGRHGWKGRKDGPSGSYVNSVSLSGVLNFVDGLWSSCVGERLMVFTTNHVDKLDPALLRPGRMDKHVHLSYCEASAFRTLARNYLYVEDDDYPELMREAEELLPKAKMTPADVAEVFMGCEDDSGMGMRMVVEEMKRRAAAAELAEQRKVEEKGAEREEEAPPIGSIIDEINPSIKGSVRRKMSNCGFPPGKLLAQNQRLSETFT